MLGKTEHVGDFFMTYFSDHCYSCCSHLHREEHPRCYVDGPPCPPALSPLTTLMGSHRNRPFRPVGVFESMLLSGFPPRFCFPLTGDADVCGPAPLGPSQHASQAEPSKNGTGQASLAGIPARTVLSGRENAVMSKAGNFSWVKRTPLTGHSSSPEMSFSLPSWKG